MPWSFRACNVHNDPVIITKRMQVQQLIAEDAQSFTPVGLRVLHELELVPASAAS